MYAFQTIIVALAAAASVSAVPTSSKSQSLTVKEVAARCGDNKAYCCDKRVDHNGGILGGLSLADSCAHIPVLAIPIEKSCAGRVCCSGTTNGVVNLQCFQGLL